MLKNKSRFKNLYNDPVIRDIIESKNYSDSYLLNFGLAYASFFEFTNQQITVLKKDNTKEELKNILCEWKNKNEKKLGKKTIKNYHDILNGIINKVYKSSTNKFQTKDITNDSKVQEFIFKKNITQNTINAYSVVLTSFSNHIQKTPTDLIKEQNIEQRSHIQDNVIIEYNPLESSLNDYINSWTLKLKSKNLKNNSIIDYNLKLRTFLTFFNIKLPEKIKLPKNNKELLIPSRDMIKTAIDTGNSLEKAIYSFLASTGIRSGDMLNFTIGDFMNSTYEYHQTNNVKEFLRKAPQNMMGYWEFTPQKTKRNNISCKVFNSPESSNYILQYLKFRKTKLDIKNKKDKTEYTLHKKDPLFAPYKRNINHKYSYQRVYDLFAEKNDILQSLERTKLLNQLDNQIIDYETYEEKLEQIPEFQAHQMRRYATTIFANKGINLRISALFEGHAPPMTNDNSYVKLSKETLKKEYIKCLPELSFEKTEINTITDAEKQELEELREFMKDIKQTIESPTNNIQQLGGFVKLPEIKD